MQGLVDSWSSELVECIHFLHAKGYAPATSSNYSFRLPGEEGFYISASGIDKGIFTKNHLMKVDSQGRALADERKPSAETLLHVMIYQQLPEAACVLHTHSVHNTVLSTLHATEGTLRLQGFEVLKGLSGIRTHDTQVDLPIFANSQDMSDLSAEITDYWQRNPSIQGFLLAGHGLYTWGETIAEAKRQVEVFEFLFECFYKIQMLRTSIKQSTNHGHIAHS